jgi:hypothetical protein
MPDLYGFASFCYQIGINYFRTVFKLANTFICFICVQIMHLFRTLGDKSPKKRFMYAGI